MQNSVKKQKKKAVCYCPPEKMFYLEFLSSIDARYRKMRATVESNQTLEVDMNKNSKYGYNQ